MDNFVDEIDCGNFFDQIDDLIEFPLENECGVGNLIGSGDCEVFPSMWTYPLPDSDPLFSVSYENSEPDLSAELSVPYEDIVQLEWLSTFVEDSFSDGGMIIGKENTYAVEPAVNRFQTSSPVSVLESSSSSSSCSGGKTLPPIPTYHGPQRARSKRPRPTTFNPRAAINLISSSSSFIETPQIVAPVIASESENFADSLPPTKKVPELSGVEPKKKKIKVTFPAKPFQTLTENPDQSVRKCLHCEITKTPQWRSGPLGPKTLCNACGVRYKSGRLFPEYRPAASPTFVPSLHSNSHKKVVEMRTKVEPMNTYNMAIAAKPKFIHRLPKDSKQFV